LSNTSPRPGIFRSAAAVALAALFLWLIFTKTFVAYLAASHPDAARTIRPGDPGLLVRLGTQAMAKRWAALDSTSATLDPGAQRPAAAATPDTIAPGGDAPPAATAAGEAPAQIRAWMISAIQQEPLNATAFRILGQLAAEADPNSAAADAFMKASAERSLHDAISVYWTMRRDFEAGRYREAVVNADALLRTRPQSMKAAAPILARMAEKPEASSELTKVLAANPPWRPAFFANLTNNITDARSPLNLLNALKDTPSPPKTNELKPYMKLLIDNKLFELAYYSWLQFLSDEELQEAGFVYNGAFERPPSGLPFDWTLSSSSGVTLDVRQRDELGGGSALYVEFGSGRVDFRPVSQMTLLPAGDYRFSGANKGELNGARGLKWKITCAGEKQPLGESAMFQGLQPNWSNFEFPFTVPAAACPAQLITLSLDSRSASETFVSGSVWYDNLKIVR
jgi:tetratricopeptide (TPR) repeat protein